MSNKNDEILGAYGRWAEAFTDKGLDKALDDQARLKRGMLRQDIDCRVTPASPTKPAYDAVRASRDDLDYREWNEDTGFSGNTRWPAGPGIPSRGVETESQQRRRSHIEQLDDGF